MDSLRITLIIIGLIIVGGIYFKFRSSDDDLILWLKKTVSPLTKKFVAANAVPLIDDDLIPVLTPLNDEPDSSDFAALSAVISGRERFEEYSTQHDVAFSAIAEENEKGPESLLIVLNIMSPKGQLFTGEGIHAVMTSAGLIHGEHKIYHYMQDKLSVFSIANVVEPGFFDPLKLQNLSTPGLAIFMELPGPIECRKAFETLLEISQRLTNALSGELCDEKRSVLTQQTISHIKEKVEAYRLKQQTSQRHKHHS